MKVIFLLYDNTINDFVFSKMDTSVDIMFEHSCSDKSDDEVNYYYMYWMIF